jgi:hypothetical protein
MMNVDVDALDAVLAWMRLLGARMWWCGCGDLTTSGPRCDACVDIDRMFPVYHAARPVI